MIVIAGNFPKYQRKCGGCGKPIGEDEQFFCTKHGDRLWHDECWAQEESYNDVYQAAYKYLGESANKERIVKQAKTLVGKGRKLSGIILSLDYWFGKRQESVEKAHGGIGIVDYIYDDAANDYRQQMEKEKRQRESVNADGPHDNFLSLDRKVPTQILKRTNFNDKNLFHLD